MTDTSRVSALYGDATPDECICTTLEEISQNAWPGLRQLIYDGWVLRFANGFTRRANSVSPLYVGQSSIMEKIVCCEEIYRRAGLPAIFKMFPAANALQMDELLAARGYERQAITSMQLLTLESCARPENGTVQLFNKPALEWLEAYAQCCPSSVEIKILHRRILEQVGSPMCLALAMLGETPVACGLGVLERGYVGLFDIVTHPAHRRMGHSTQVIRSILHWARAHGAVQAYLQVMMDNMPAMQLYAKFGFRHLYHYWYRVQR